MDERPGLVLLGPGSFVVNIVLVKKEVRGLSVCLYRESLKVNGITGRQTSALQCVPAKVN